MKKKTNPIMLSRARSLRKNMTSEERKLWYVFLRRYPIKVYKQKIIGPYIIDFYCDGAKLAIEIDGGQHYEEKGEIYDNRRTEWLNTQGIKVLRFSNWEINREFIGVCEMIDGEIQERIKALSVAFGDTSPGGGGKDGIASPERDGGDGVIP